MKNFLLLTMIISISGFSQTPLTLPDIGGKEITSGAPTGWTISSQSPDIIQGNGLWSSQYDYYTVTGIEGDTSGGSMGFFIALPGSYSEGWQTVVKDLEVGKEYSVTIKWQQCSYNSTEAPIYGAGGGLAMGVDGDEQFFSVKSHKDEWHEATIVFTAKATTANVVIRAYIPAESNVEVEAGVAIVVENADCQECREAGR